MRDQPVKVAADELRKLMGSRPEWELFDGMMTVTWIGKQGAMARFHVEILIDVKAQEQGKEASAQVKIAGTLSAEVATAAVVETEMNGAIALRSVIPMNARVMEHSRRR